ncbi:Signal transduction histidine kinase, nitrogen specific, NtrB [Candidatus Methylobacter favarea]|uniref:histidine kinase n=1 Tax=Candidatus Methylobacter favarea TaxID=2707345 RepID=A0A8S0YAS4_9GAMM|nr:PAS domain S-box protein [Candidatus Methylobacter favarea]CAA9892477.1 Signal transduction histidine kinase, nitrogen specific, NtrB [Candidatus Methylobacter favarea]
MSLINPAENKKTDDNIRRQAKCPQEVQDSIRKRAEALLDKSETDIARLSTEDFQKLLFEFQVHQIELELQNEELNRAHRELGASRDRYAQLFNLSPLVYLTLDIKGAILAANLAAARLLSCPREKLGKRKLGEFVNPADQNIYYFFLRDLTTRQSDQTVEIRLIVDKRPIDVECHATLAYRENRNPEIWLTINDITESKKARQTIINLNKQLLEKVHDQTEELMEANRQLQKKIDELEYSKHQLAEREAKLNCIFNASIEGIITIDAAGKIVSANSAVATIFGFMPDELVGHSITRLIPAAKAKQLPDFRTYLNQQIAEFTHQVREVEGLRKDGSVVPLDLSVAEFTVDKARYFAGIIRDVSLRKRQAKQDKDHLEALAHVTRLGLMGEMASGIAHEVNQPLTAISGYTQACLNLIASGTGNMAGFTEILQKTHSEALRAGQIIHRMREFVKSRTIYRISAEINALVQEAASLCAADFKHNSIQIKYELTKDLPRINVDKVQIEQVLLNLFRNSCDSLKELPAERERKVVIRTYLNAHNYIEVSVKDNGTGISELRRDKVLTPFFTTKDNGMGMGLSISRSLVEAHGGSLHFNTRQEKGSTFYFTLPPAQDEGDDQADSASSG